MNKFKSECLNHQSNPDLSILDAVYMSSTFPFIFKPMYINESYYIDGGLDVDFPYDKCMADMNKDNETLSIKVMHSDKDHEAPLKKEANILEMAIFMFKKLILENRKKNENYVPKII